MTTPIERAIDEALARTRAESLEPSSVYLRPEDIIALGGATEYRGLPIKHVSGKGRPRVYTSRGLARTIVVAKEPPATFTPAEQLFLVSLLQGWPSHGRGVATALRRRHLVATRPTTRQLKGRSHTVHEPRLTGTGEAAAQRLWDGLDRAARANLRAQAMKAGL